MLGLKLGFSLLTGSKQRVDAKGNVMGSANFISNTYAIGPLLRVQNFYLYHSISLGFELGYLWNRFDYVVNYGSTGIFNGSSPDANPVGQPAWWGFSGLICS